MLRNYLNNAENLGTEARNRPEIVDCLQSNHANHELRDFWGCVNFGVAILQDLMNLMILKPLFVSICYFFFMLMGK